MRSATITDETIEAFLQDGMNGDGHNGVRAALRLLDEGVPSDDIILGVLAASQRAVGEGWLANEYTVADEHLATGVAQKALDAVADTVEPPAPRGLVVVACAEGDWHSLPAQMFAELLRSNNFAVAFLGASTPADQVEIMLARDHPDALAISCQLPIFFEGVTRLADAAHRQDVPVIAGGRAFGHAAERALRLGADAWAADVDGAIPVLRSWQQHKPAVPTAPTTVSPVALELARSADALASAALDALVLDDPAITSNSDRQRARTREELVFIVRFIAAAVLVDDPTVLAEFLEWSREFHAARGVPGTLLDAGLTALAPLLDPIDPGAATLALAGRSDS
jgi:methanogenic corrinoid protein MtbC1